VTPHQQVTGKPSLGDSRKRLELDSIIVQSPFLKRVLAQVLKDYPGVTTSLNRLTFSAPFQCFVHRWELLAAAMKSPDWDEAVKQHIDVLYKVLYPELKDVIAAKEDYLKNGVITYEHVWTIFQPGCILYARKYGHPIAVKFVQGYYGETQCNGPCFILSCNFVDWDGSKFGYNSMSQTIGPFLGAIPITDLECFPLEFHPDIEGATNSLVARGRQFESLAGYHYKHYKGHGITKQHGCTVKVTVNSRIVIDASSYGKFNPNSLASLRAIHRSFGCGTAACDNDSVASYDSYDDDSDDDKDMELGATPRITLTEDELLLCTPMIRGYALKIKRWLEFYVSEVSEVVFNDQAFNSLVLPEDQKDLILAFAKSQVKYKNAFDDVISGKGKGIIMLLSGGPGIGKTLTAESVAEEMKVPLYIMSAGDLGADAEDVEDNLSRILEMVAKWNAVLLLDECDVFLEARSSHDLDRNRIVSIFLRTLEYYEGILFLTTNRVNNMDPAFHSRIHISLEYPPLDTAARKAVWDGFLSRSVGVDGKVTGVAAHSLSDEQVGRLATLELNGRQIKNVLKTANLLACHKEQKLGYSHLKTVLRVEGHLLGE
jgi:hypothetical protein